jgi:hypothetical protein
MLSPARVRKALETAKAALAFVDPHFVEKVEFEMERCLDHLPLAE